jgi:hypothetical protein
MRRIIRVEPKVDAKIKRVVYAPKRFEMDREERRHRPLGNRITMSDAVRLLQRLHIKPVK